MQKITKDVPSVPSDSVLLIRAKNSKTYGLVFSASFCSNVYSNIALNSSSFGGNSYDSFSNLSWFELYEKLKKFSFYAAIVPVSDLSEVITREAPLFPVNNDPNFVAGNTVSFSYDGAVRIVHVKSKVENGFFWGRDQIEPTVLKKWNVEKVRYLTNFDAA